MTDEAGRCEVVLVRVTAVLRRGGDVAAEDRRHIATCSQCSDVIAAAARLEDELRADVRLEATADAVSRAVRGARVAARMEQWRRAAFIGLAALALAIPRFVVPVAPGLQGLGILLQGCGAVVGLAAVGTLVIQGLNTAMAPKGLYLRLRGSWFFGACGGLAEAAGLSVLMVRGVFLALLLLGKTGWVIAVPVYLVLGMSMEVHPEDRHMLLRFRLERWWAGRRRARSVVGAQP